MLDVAAPQIRQLLEGSGEGKYIDMYSGRHIDCPHDQGHPNTVSIDAIFPFILGRLGKPCVHAANNLAITTQSSNLLKWTQLPIFADKVGQYCRSREPLTRWIQEGDVQAAEELNLLQDRLILDCRRIAGIRRRVPWERESRESLDVSPAQLHYYMETWISGWPHPYTPAALNPGIGIGAVRGRGWILPGHQDRIIGNIRRIEEWTNVHLVKSKDSCP